MQCPRCGSAMESLVVGAELASPRGTPYRMPAVIERIDPARRELDRCTACRGVWFDAGEMVAGLREVAPTDLDLREWLRRVPFGEQQCGLEPLIHCPRCAAGMEALHSRAVPGLVFDRCPRCRGVWFDGGELKRFAEPLAAALALALDEFV